MSARVSKAVADTQAKVLEYLKNPTQGQTYGLMVVLGFGQAERGKHDLHRVDGVAESRILDRALQKLRKAGKITFGHRLGWSLTETGWTLEGVREAANNRTAEILLDVIKWDKPGG